MLMSMVHTVFFFDSTFYESTCTLVVRKTMFLLFLGMVCLVIMILTHNINFFSKTEKKTTLPIIVAIVLSNFYYQHLLDFEQIGLPVATVDGDVYCEKFVGQKRKAVRYLLVVIVKFYPV